MTFDGVPKQFLTSVRVLFDILDTKKLGYVNFCDIEARWNKENTDKLPADVVECLRNSSVNGQLTFELFVSGLQQSLKAVASKPGSPYQGGDAPPKPFKPVNLQQHGSETISSPLRTSQAAVEPIYQKPPRTSSRNYEQNGRAQSIADIPAQPITSPQHRPPYRESDAYRKQTPKRRDNSRRHTLGHGVDGSMVRRSKLLEEERRMLLKGLQSVDKVKNWYTKRLAEVADRQRYGVLEADNSNTDQQQERVAFEQLRISELNQQIDALTEPSTQGGLMRMNLARPRTTVQGRQQTIPYEPKSNPTSPTEPAAPDHVVQMMRAQNKMLTKEVAQRTDKISQLEKDKAALLKDLFEVKARLRSQQYPHSQQHGHRHHSVPPPSQFSESTLM